MVCFWPLCVSGRKRVTLNALYVQWWQHMLWDFCLAETGEASRCLWEDGRS